MKNEDREFAKWYNREQKRKDEFLNHIGNKINKIFYTIDIKKEVLYEILTGKHVDIYIYQDDE